MASDTGDRILGNLERHVEEQSSLVHQPHADMTMGFRQVKADIDHVNTRIDRLMLTMLVAIGGGVLAALIGIIAALLVMIAQGE